VSKIPLPTMRFDKGRSEKYHRAMRLLADAAGDLPVEQAEALLIFLQASSVSTHVLVHTHSSGPVQGVIQVWLEPTHFLLSLIDATERKQLDAFFAGRDVAAASAVAH